MGIITFIMLSSKKQGFMPWVYQKKSP